MDAKNKNTIDLSKTVVRIGKDKYIIPALIYISALLIMVGLICVTI